MYDVWFLKYIRYILYVYIIAMDRKGYTLYELCDRIKDMLQYPGIIPQIYNSTSHICKILLAIVTTDGDDWQQSLLRQNIFQEAEMSKLSSVISPYIEPIRNFFKKRTHKGGDATTNDKTINDKTTNDKTTINTTIPDGKRGISGPDDVLESMDSAFSTIDTFVNNNVALLREQYKQHDEKDDYHILPLSVINSMKESPQPAVKTAGEVIEKIKIPFRMIVFLVYLILDVIRMSAALAGLDTKRKMLSIVVSIFDLLKGDWKKAVFSFIGYYSTSYAVIGEMMKIFLTLYQSLSPTLRHNMLYGSVDATKSVIIGLLLEIYKITAPQASRIRLLGIIQKIQDVQRQTDAVLQSAGLPPRSSDLSPTMEDINNLQAICDDPIFVCSKEYGEYIETINTEPMINFVLQMLRVPTSPGMTFYRCNSIEKLGDPMSLEEAIKYIKEPHMNERKSFVEYLAKEGFTVMQPVTTEKTEVKTEETEVKTEEPEVKTEVKTEDPEVKTEETEVKTEVKTEEPGSTGGRRLLRYRKKH
jgi:hypothetical protein